MTNQENRPFAEESLSLTFYPDVDREDAKYLTQVKDAHIKYRASESDQLSMERDDEQYECYDSGAMQASYQTTESRKREVDEAKTKAAEFAAQYKDELLQNALTTAAINGIRINTRE